MEQWYRSIISGERAGALPAILRFVFAVLSIFYTVIVVLRNFFYDRGILKITKLPVPVISVGNITTGGTGKTPTVILIVKELKRLGKNPAVLTRGYGAPKGQTPDEVLVIQHECADVGGVPVIVNPDRVAGGRQAIAKHHADCLVLDDGFQHRRLHRDLDLVLVDATAPMGIPGVLPKGTWREPPSSLARASVIMLTRCEQISQDLADLAAGLLTQWVAPRNIYQQSTFTVGLFDHRDQPLVLPPGQRVLCFAGIGNPNSFLQTVRNLNGGAITVSAAVWFNDHHVYTIPGDFAPMERLTRSHNLDSWITTLKDLVKLQHVSTPVPLYYLRIESRLPQVQSEVFRQTLAAVVGHGPTDPAATPPNPAA